MIDEVQQVDDEGVAKQGGLFDVGDDEMVGASYRDELYHIIKQMESQALVQAQLVIRAYSLLDYIDRTVAVL